ncbi:family 43 glycosylhydrolase [Cellulosimicrobium cellulans]|uniref:beta-xylosidase family glycoside hydrolase n=1 Tax=Cellulosimicrobium cellulans TaxID=1710 RepID=UPI0018844C52|nr:family 43 glycosylhydrolase [Cellulosimicrobium cellulans]MBE9926051.1 family 43 glycosylhydrolase [Cellulosimicrobium cellulans]
MSRHRRRRAAATIVAGVLALGVGLPAAQATATADDEPPAATALTGLTTTDRGDGTYDVPLLRSDVPDISVTRVPAAENDEGRDLYYMISTTMHLAPGAPIMKSYDLVSWEIVGYVYDRLGVGDVSSLRNGKNGYGNGQWASSLRYRDGSFYVVFNTNDLGGSYLFRTDDVEHGAWERTALGRGFHDPSLFFDEADGGTPYIFYGSGATSAVRLNDDLTAIEADFPNIFRAADYAGEPFVGGLFEGAQVHYIDGEYYVAIITWPSGQNRQEVLFRSPHLLGRYETADGSNPYEARSALNSDGFAQGGLVEVPDGAGGYEWWGMFFRDTYPLGRIPALVPATWEDGWPTFGDDGVVRVGDTFAKPIVLDPATERRERLKSIVASDDFANDAEHRAFSDTVWEVPDAPTYDESLLGVELVANPGFEDAGTAPWAAQFGATLSRETSGAASGTGALRVAGRTLNGSGPNQQLGGKIQAGVTYEVSARVRYASGPAQVRFNLVGDWGAGVTTLAGANATPGEWTTVRGTYTVPQDADVRTFKLAVETPWGNPQPPSSSVEYLLDDVSVVGRAPAVETPTLEEVSYNGSDLDLAWQWNHAPDNRYWSLTEREGWLRLTNGHVVTGEAEYTKAPGRDLTYLEEARNTLGQRTFGPTSSAETRLDVSGMLDGDVAGLAVYGRSFAYAGVQQVDGERTLGLVTRLQPFTDTIDREAVESFVPGSQVPLGERTNVHLKADADFASPNGQLWVQYSFSLDGRTWQPLGPRQGPLVMDWSLSHFMGYRFGLFSYAKELTGGHVDFDHFLLSDVLDADGGADRSALDAVVAEAEGLDPADHTAESWAAVEQALAWARATTAPSTQNQADAPARALALAVASLEPTTSPDVAFAAEAGLRALAGTDYVAVRVVNEEDVPVDVVVATPYGSRTFADVRPGTSAYQAFPTRRSQAPAGEVTVTVTRSTDAVTTTRTVPFGR